MPQSEVTGASKQFDAVLDFQRRFAPRNAVRVNFNDDPRYKWPAQSCAAIRPSGIELAWSSDILKAFIGRGQSGMEATEAKNGQKMAKNSHKWLWNWLTKKPLVTDL